MKNFPSEEIYFLSLLSPSADFLVKKKKKADCHYFSSISAQDLILLLLLLLLLVLYSNLPEGTKEHFVFAI